jgi:hypothetical protein
MIEMDVDSTDPVEPPPAGDVTFREAREIVQDRLTLIGNLEFDELENREPDYIASRVKEILSHGSDRLVIGSSAGPIHALTPKIATNYKSWIKTYLEHVES